MKRRTLIPLVVILIALIAPAAGAQTPKPPQPPKPQQKPAPKPTPAPLPPDQSGLVSMKLERGGRVAVSNRAGRIRITGGGGDSVEASASSEMGSEPVQIQVTGETGRSKIALSIPNLEMRRGYREIYLDVKLPRYADVEVIDSRRGDIEVADVDGIVAINGGNGDVNAARVGTLKVGVRSGDITAREVKGDFTARTNNGDVTAEGVGGPADVAATNGDIIVRNAAGDVRANTASGNIDVLCAKGRAEVNTASGSIMLVGVGGDLDANTASGSVIFRGHIRERGRYRLKSISGEVEMAIQTDAPGFTATLITYSGEIETDFPLKVDSPLQGGPINRRITGRYGDGQAQLVLDSFSGTVRIIKGTAAALGQCK